MTQWTENPEGGRARGPGGLVRAWVEVLVRPRRFFANGIGPSDQAPGLVFAMAVVLVEESVRFALVDDAYPVVADSEPLSAALWLGVTVLLVAPAAVHLLAALQTVLLAPFAPDRGGVSETVQVIAYATAPMVLAGVGVPPAFAGVAGLETAVAVWRLLLALWGTALFVVGIATVHDTSLPRAAVAAAVPVVVVFGYFFGGVFAFETATGVSVVGA